MNSQIADYRFQTKTGLRVTLRPMQDEDAPHLLDIFEHLGPQSRYQRFHSALANPDPKFVQSMAERLAHVEPPSEGWLAFADLPEQPNAPIGGGRFVLTEADVAEVALTVRDDLQGEGIGRKLLGFLIEEARKVGIDKLYGIVQVSNLGIWHMLQHFGYPVRRYSKQGETYVEIDISGREGTENS